jgi:2-polyprenyl-3-methyl-5-hydroxy-6-metoxy-1,4-benzoquinol methylase
MRLITSSETAARHLETVSASFSRTGDYWKHLYQQQSVFGLIIQLRHATALQWVDALSLPPGSRVLEAGCGAGLLSVSLARRGYLVDGIDGSQTMVDLARTEADRAGVSDRMMVKFGDMNALPFEDRSHHLVVALGVIPWLYSPAVGLAEVVRVLRPGGYAILSSRNCFGLNYLLDPRLAPPLVPLKRLLRRAARALGHDRPEQANRMSLKAFVRLLLKVGLKPVRHRAVGFGPFTFLGKPLVSEEAGLQLHRWLQERADRGTALLRMTGSQNLVLARRA